MHQLGRDAALARDVLRGTTMERKNSNKLYAIIGATALAGCYAPPASEERFDDSIVVTSHDVAADFGKFQTFFVRPEIRLLDEGILPGEMPEIASPAVAAPLIEATERNLTARGYTEVATKEEADLAVELVYLRTVNSVQYCYYYYGWYDYYYWGYYPGYSYYYPYCDTSAWRSGTLLSNVVDLTTVDPPVVIDGVVQAVAAGSSTVLSTVWYSAVYGVELDSVSFIAERAVDGIDQSFIQSPYFTAAP
jgi:hypothetical protein